MRQLAVRIAAVVILAITLINSSLFAEAESDLWDHFKSPPPVARPFMRWWWPKQMNLSKKEMERQLDLLHAAGFGGVEITQLGNAQKSDVNKQNKWPEPYIINMLRHAALYAKKIGMICDINPCPGWPWKVKDIKDAQQRVYNITYRYKGPASVQIPRKEVLAKRHVWKEGKILTAGLFPVKMKDFSTARKIDLAGAGDAAIAVNIPDGEWHVNFVVAAQSGGRKLDHLSRDATLNFLESLETIGLATKADADQPLFRAFFSDSLELGGPNWTEDFDAEFEKRRGYDLKEYYDLILADMPDPGAHSHVALPGPTAKVKHKKGKERVVLPKPDSPEVRETLRRVRQDWCLTMQELFAERYVGTAAQWGREHGMQLRIQCSGAPAGFSSLLNAPIPETEIWINGYRDKRPHLFGEVRRAASAAGISGRSLTSIEAATCGDFSTTLEDIKRLTDLSLIMGANHFIYHGMDYSPRENGFPGYYSFGTYFREWNPCWAHMKHFTDYCARLSLVLQQSAPKSEIAFLPAEPDAWADYGMSWSQTACYPLNICGPLVEAAGQHGLGLDYINRSCVEQAKVRDGKIIIGMMAYDVLALAPREYMELSCIRAMKRLLEDGGKVAFLGRLPDKTVGLKGRKSNDQELALLLKEMMKWKGRGLLHVLDPAGEKLTTLHDPKGRQKKTETAREYIRAIKKMIKPKFSVQPVQPEVFISKRTAGDREIYILVNHDAQNEAHLQLTLKNDGKSLWLWDPETGKRHPLACDGQVDVCLDPADSLLLVSDRKDGNEAKVTGLMPDSTECMLLKGPWAVTCTPVEGKVFTMHMDELTGLSESMEKQASQFSGVASYETTFDLKDASFTSLDLGPVNGISEVTLNGKALGVRWYGRHTYPVEGLLRNGKNQLTVEIATTLRGLARARQVKPKFSGGKKIIEGLSGPVSLR